MKLYMVNQSTKEHCLIDEEVPLVIQLAEFKGDWKLVQADDEGFITFTGYECPVSKGIKVEWIGLNGFQGLHWDGSKVKWVNGSQPITHYRPIFDTQEESTEDSLEVIQELECKIECLTANLNIALDNEQRLRNELREIKAEHKKPYLFDRYRFGVKMAEGVRIDKADTLEQALMKASRLLADNNYPKGDVLVLVENK